MELLAPPDNEVLQVVQVLMVPLDHPDPLDPQSASLDPLEELDLTEQQVLKD